jgi:hypothetical protein
MVEEEWRVVPSSPWLEASSLGRVRRVTQGKGGNGRPKILRGSITKRGYITSNSKHFGVLHHNKGFHALVCEAFHGPQPTEWHEVAHWDGNPGNNLPENLRWVTPKENAQDRSRHGRQMGENHPTAKLLAPDIVAIRNLKQFGYRGSDIALMFDMNRNSINRIAAGKGWVALTVSSAANAALSFGC